MAKKQTFADKVAKQQSKSEGKKIIVKVVEAKKSDNGAWKFNERMVSVESLDKLDDVLN